MLKFLADMWSALQTPTPLWVTVGLYLLSVSTQLSWKQIAEAFELHKKYDHAK